MAIDLHQQIDGFKGIVALACLALAGCGGSASDSAPPPRQIAMASAVPALADANTRDPSDPGDPPDPPPPPAPPPEPVLGTGPTAIDYIVAAPFIASDVALDIVVGKNVPTPLYPSALCLHEDNPLVARKCLPVKAPFPANMVLSYLDGGDLGPEARMLMFAPVEGVTTDLTGSIVATAPWVQALASASEDWGRYLEAHPGAVGVRNPGTANLGDPDAPTIPVVLVPGYNPWNPPGMPDPVFPYPTPPIGPPWPKDTLYAQAIPLGPPCALVGMGGLCSVTIFGARPPKAPAKQVDPAERGHQFFAPQILCDWHILCNVGQEPRPVPVSLPTTPQPPVPQGPEREKKLKQCVKDATDRARECMAMARIYSPQTLSDCADKLDAEAKDCNTLYGP